MENITPKQKAKVTIYKDVKKIAVETGKHIGMELDKSSLELAGEVVWKKIKEITEDLELFAKHAKRSRINADDIKLLARKNPSLQNAIHAAIEKGNAASAGGKKRRPTKVTDEDDEESAQQIEDVIEVD